MRYFTEKIQVDVRKGCVEKAAIFAQNVSVTVDYRDSNQTIEARIRHDHFISKLGEEAVYSVFSEFASDVTKPDYAIYQKKQKSWNADLLVNGAELAVKTQSRSSAQKYGLSWTFQCSWARRDPILDRPNNWVCFVECANLNTLYSCTVFPPYQIKNLTFREPQLAYLKGKKLVVYAADLFEA